MRKNIFRYISPDPKSNDDKVPMVFYWQMVDLLIGARFILRRRNADEVAERANLVNRKVLHYADKIAEEGKRFGKPISIFPDDATFLCEIIKPDRVSQLKRTTKKGKAGGHGSFLFEEGWIKAEDFAILALLKLDQSIDALADEQPEDILVSAGALLEAYRCLLLAERFGGRGIKTVEEFIAFQQSFIDNKKALTSEQNSRAAQSRRKAKLKEQFLETYHKMRQERPLENINALADEISSKYLASLPEMPEDERVEFISEKQAKRTVREWIQKEHKKQLPADSPKQARQRLRQKHQF